MATLKFYKVVAVLPEVLEGDAVYLVRVGEGFDLYLTDLTGAIAYRANSVVSTLSEDTTKITPVAGGIEVDSDGWFASHSISPIINGIEVELL